MAIVFRRKSCKAAVSLALIITFVVSSFAVLTMVNNVHAATGGLYLKWETYLPGVETHIGALAAKMVPGQKGYDIVVEGASQIDQGEENGTVACLDSNGNVLWEKNPGNIGDHQPFEIGDLNNDGNEEIVTSNMGDTLALYLNNGSTYWKNNAAPSYDVSPVLADINGDGYLEVFVASGEGPYQGIDYTTELTHTGQIVAQVNDSWHPCFGGLSMAYDPSDGEFILLQGDRSQYYNPQTDPYKYGGWGVHAMDAQTLNMLWNDSNVLDSSQIPMVLYSGVDGDGVPDVVTAWQFNGLAVYNLTSGSVSNTDGVYRRAQNLNMSAHSQPTIYIDQNGDPEYITAYTGPYPQIWNLRTWTLTATLNVSGVGEPPKMGQVTADGNMDIIAVGGNDVHVFNENFQEVANFTGLNSPNEMSLVGDIDGDGYNEIILTSRSGWVYCLGTNAKASTPGPNLNVDFYSNSRLGVAQYVPAPGPVAPQISNPSPTEGAVNVSTTLSQLTFQLKDYQQKLVNYTVTTSPNIGSGAGTNVKPGTYSVPVSSLRVGTTYTWTVNATDGTYNTVTTFNFTTAGKVSPPIPTLVISGPSPANNTANVSINLSTLSFTLNNNQGKQMNYTVKTTPNIGTASVTNVTNGTYNLSIGGLSYSTNYTWVVNATTTDGTLSNNTTYAFTTAQQPPPPSNGTWWNYSWSYRQNVTIDHTKVAASLTNFPVLVNIPDPGLAAYAQSNGNDIVFIDSNGNKLNHEIESYNSSTGNLTAWVDIPNLSSTSDTTLYMYYGNPTAPNQQNPAGVWDSNYLMVQHLQGTSGTQYDSTSNNNNGSPVGAVTEGVPGKIDGCDQFAGGYVSLPQVCTSQTQFTFSAWIYAQSGARYIISEWASNQGAFLQVSGDSAVQFYVNGVMVQQSVTLGQWHYVVGTYDGTTARLYLDGGSPASASAANPTWGSQTMFIGDRYDHTRTFNGLIDEVRVSSIARSSSWIATEYANQNSPSTFYTIGPQEVPATYAPIVSNPVPANGQSGVSLNPTLSVSISDFYNNPMNITFLSNSTGTWQNLGGKTNVSKGVYNQPTTAMNSYLTTYWWSVQVTDGTSWTNETFQFTTKSSSSNWYNPSWQYRMNITINHTQVSSDQTNFPLLVELTDSALTTEAQPNGQDFVFTDINNNKLNDEIESYNSSTGQLIAWVEIPLLSSTTDTTVMLYYGNPTCPDQQNATGVWDSNYLMVLHMNGNQTVCNDSTTNGNNGTLNGSVSQAPGIIDGSLNFSGGYVALPQVCTTQTQFTFSAWIYAESGARYIISEWANSQGAFLQVTGNSVVQFYVNGVMVQESVSLGQWYYVVGTFNGTTATLYLDGGSPVSVSALSPVWGSQTMYIGDRYDHTRMFLGLIDEVRVSSIARSSSWIATEYANQNSPSTFYTIGIQETYS